MRSLIDPSWPARLASGWLLLPLAWSIFYIYVLPSILQRHWSSVEAFFGNSPLALGVMLPWVAHGIQLLAINVMFTCIYAVNLPFFEQHRIIKDKAWHAGFPKQVNSSDILTMGSKHFARNMIKTIMKRPTEAPMTGEHSPAISACAIAPREGASGKGGTKLPPRLIPWLS